MNKILKNIYILLLLVIAIIADYFIITTTGMDYLDNANTIENYIGFILIVGGGFLAVYLIYLIIRRISKTIEDIE